jgi:hypothetical protein
MLRTFLILILPLALIFFSCKKEKKDSVIPPVEEVPPAPYDFTITTLPSTTGNQWVYSNVVTTTVQTINGPNSNTVTYSNSYTSTVTIIGDTLLPGSISGKIWLNNTGVLNSNYKEVAYLNPLNNLYYVLPIDTLKGFRGYCIKVPLVKNIFWSNANLMPQDTSYSKAIEQYFNGKEYFNVINVERAKGLFLKDYYKLNNKGVVLHKNFKLEFLGIQVISIETTRQLFSTNF